MIRGGETVLTESRHWVDGAAGPIPVAVWEATRPVGVALLVHGATYSGPTAFGFALAGDHSLATWLAANGITAVTFAIRGYGQSPAPVDGFSVTTAAALDDLERVADWIQSARRVDRLHLLGWSWGGRIAGRWAAANPERVDRLVLFAGALLDGPPPEPPLAPYRHNDEASVLARLEPELTEPSLRKAFASHVARHEPRSPTGVFAELAGGSPPVEPTSIRRPTLLIYGAADRLYQPNPVAAFFAQLATDDKALVVLPGAGHFLQVQRPRQRFFAAVSNFFLAESTQD
jgi:alpha-beta hydrolase superfamily lysophospholipase